MIVQYLRYILPVTDMLCTCILSMKMWRITLDIQYFKNFEVYTGFMLKFMEQGQKLSSNTISVPLGSRIFSSPRRLDRLWG
jgi:hypothetical protein